MMWVKIAVVATLVLLLYVFVWSLCSIASDSDRRLREMAANDG